MPSYRQNSLVVDLNVLPSIPDIETIRKFLTKDVALDFSKVRNLQLNISMNQVIIEMATPDQAAEIAGTHSAKHCIIYEKKKFYIPLYVEDDSTPVKVHDLPPNMPNHLIAEQLQQYGKVTSIHDEVWRDFFPGIPNGVRVVRIKLEKPIPSFLKIDGLLAYIVYPNQKKTCRHCSRKLHPGQKCTSTKTKVTTSCTTPLDADQTKIVNNKEAPITTTLYSSSNYTPIRDIEADHCNYKEQREKQQIQQQFITSPAKTIANKLVANEWTIQKPKPKRRLTKIV